MKKSVKYTFALGLTILAFQACTTVDYDGEYAKKGEYDSQNQVYFHAKNDADTLTNFSFGTLPTTVTRETVHVRVDLAGRLKAAPQAIKIVVDSKSTAQEGVHFLLPEQQPVIPADSGYVNYPVVLLRDHLSDTQNDHIRLVLRLEPSSEVNTRFADKLKYTITFDNVLEKPTWWDSYLRAYFGMPPFTPAKYRMLLSFYNNDPKEIEKAMGRSGITQLYRNVQKVIAYFRAHPE